MPGFSSGTNPSRAGKKPRIGDVRDHASGNVNAFGSQAINNERAIKGELHNEAQKGFQFKSYNAVRSIIYQAQAVRNQFIIQQLMKRKTLAAKEAKEAKKAKESKSTRSVLGNSVLSNFTLV